MIFLLFLFFVLGSAIGSFLNVLIDRSLRQESILGRSYCDYCRAKLSTLDLIPIASFFALGGRCRYCQRRISWQYPLVELATAVLFAISFYRFASAAGSIIGLIFSLFIVSVMVIVSVVDFKYSLIPTTFIFAASFVTLFYKYFSLSSSFFVSNILAAFGASLFFLLIVLMTRERGMDTGDVFLGFLIGLVLGLQDTLLAVFLAFTSGAVVAVLLILFGKKRFGQTIPFAPFLVLGFLAAFYFAKPILSWYLMLY